jgi:hypothetical protein
MDSTSNDLLDAGSTLRRWRVSGAADHLATARDRDEVRRTSSNAHDIDLPIKNLSSG